MLTLEIVEYVAGSTTIGRTSRFSRRRGAAPAAGLFAEMFLGLPITIARPRHRAQHRVRSGNEAQ